MNTDENEQRGDLTVAQWREFARLEKTQGTDAADAYLHAIRRATYARNAARIQDTRMSSRSAAVFTFFAHLCKGSLIVLPCSAVLGLPGFYVAGGIALGVAALYACGAYVDRRLL